ncbi:putative glycosyltransferase EpsJ [BD1-7 clade bacterium]|uniref:Putative glycosyltransferase EpsJ n=1 Tax=BD1-7 clade bacterium TaxID=2029982 RepID=A0A5S9QWH7_9GAMM|nr:putative glycosyltransferase EpsJ [BD1-7 clade bacterium]
MNAPKVSVVIPVYNTEQYLIKCLDSVVQQTLQHIEIIVVVDASPDNALALVSSYADNDQRIQIVHKTVNEGLAAARSSGLRIATAEYVIFLDSDDFWTDDCALSELYMTAQADQCDVLRFNGYRYVDGELTIPLMNGAAIINGALATHEALWVFRSIFLFLFKRQFIVDNQLDFIAGQDIGEDGIFLSAALSCCDSVSSVGDFFYAYRENSESMMNARWHTDKFLEEETSSRLIADNLQRFDRTRQSYLLFRIGQYWPKKLASRAVRDISRKDRYKLYDQSLTNFTDLQFNHSQVNRRIRLRGRLIYALLASGRYKTLDVCVRLLEPYFWFAEQVDKIKYLNLLRLKNNPVIRRLAQIIRYKLRFTAYRDVLLRRFDKPRHFRNLENIDAYHFDHIEGPKPVGVSAMLRVKNEANVIAQCIGSIMDVFDEIVVIDNGSTDATVSIVRELQERYAASNKEIRIFSYPHEIARCGLEHKQTPENSIHSLAYYYNWCLSHCRYSYVCKWDADMLLPSALDEQRNLRQRLLEVANSASRILATLPIQTVYIDALGKFYCDKAEVNEEMRLFPNCPSIYFKKAADWEVLETAYPLPFIRLQYVIIYEVKDSRKNEFDHWSSVSQFTGRKVKEYRNYQKTRLNYHLSSGGKFSQLEPLVAESPA